MIFQHDDQLNTLQIGKLDLRGEFFWGSNYTFLTVVEHNGNLIRAVYKPTQGVRPLWDFPQASLAKREVAAYILSEALGWKLVPPTVYRLDGPFGAGSLQLFVEHDPEYHYFRFSTRHIQRLRPTALFDFVINNADRKGSHILFDPNDHLWLIDHGVCFHVTPKLRTVVWDFVEEQIPEKLLCDLVDLRQKLNDGVEQSNSFVRSLENYINLTEIRAISDRIGKLVQSGTFPVPDPNRRQYPWPEI